MLSTFERKHDFLVCVNAAGCVMDTLNRRHFHCYGPCVVRHWELDQWRVPVLERWNQVNLLHMTRGIHPFKALAVVLSEVNRACTPIAGIEAFREWTEGAGELSDEALEERIACTPQGEGRKCLEKALEWSKAAQAGIAQLPIELMAPFQGARETLAMIHKMADVAVLTDDAYGVIKAEWARHGLLDYADIFLCNDLGGKHRRIGTMLKCGYQPDHVLVVGDTPEDWDAAELNDVGFFPIVVNQEKESWQELQAVGLDRLCSLSYHEYQPEAKRRFLAGLGAI